MPPEIFLLLRRSFWLIAISTAICSRLFAHGDLHEAIDRLSQQILQEPKNYLLYLQRGELQVKHANPKAALADYERAERLEADLPVLRLLRAKAFLALGELEKARENSAAFLKRRPQHREGLLTHAKILARLDDPKGAAVQLGKLIATGNADAEIHLERARLLTLAGEPAEATQTLEAAIKDRGPAPTLLLALIRLHVEQKNFPAAVEWIDKAIRNSGRPELWRLRKGEILEKAGRPREAQKVYEQALRELESEIGSARNAAGPQKVERDLRAALARLTRP
jgi:tetratricopeptide (TPR) repeat protein